MRLQSKRGYNRTVTKSIHVVTLIKYESWTTLKNLCDFWYFTENYIYANIWHFHTLHYHSSWKLKTRLNYIIDKEFYFKNGRQHYKFIVLSHEITFFRKDLTKCKEWYTDNEVIIMMKFVIDSIFVESKGHLFQQIICIPMWTKCAHLLADGFLYIVSLWGCAYTKAYQRQHKYRN